MANVAISGDSSGAVTLTVPATAGTQTVTFPAATGTAMVSGNMPAFSAYQNSAQSIGSQVETKVQFNTKDFDTNSCYSTSTYRFTPTVAGYYQITITVSVSSYSGGTQPIIYKNGSVWMYGTYPNTSSSAPNWTEVSGLVYCNGSTDYIEAYFFSSASSTTQGNSLYRFQGYLARTA